MEPALFIPPPPAVGLKSPLSTLAVIMLSTVIASTSVPASASSQQQNLPASPYSVVQDWRLAVGNEGRVGALTADASGNIYVVGSRPNRSTDPEDRWRGAFMDAFTIEGEQLWSILVTGADTHLTATGVALDGVGNLLVSGYSEGSASTWRSYVFLRSYSAEGELRWSNESEPTWTLNAYGLAIDSDGNSYVAGSSLGTFADAIAHGAGSFMRSYSPAGETRWTREFGKGSNFTYWTAGGPSSLAYAVGHTYKSPEDDRRRLSDVFVTSYSSDGRHEWSTTFGGPFRDIAVSAAVDDYGNLAVGGFTEGDLATNGRQAREGFIRSFSPDGTERWEARFNDPEKSGSITLTSVASEPDGTIYAAGTLSGGTDGMEPGHDRAFLQAYSVGGQLLWTHWFGEGEATSIEAIASVNGGRFLVVTGTAVGPVDVRGEHDTFGFIRILARQ